MVFFLKNSCFFTVTAAITLYARWTAITYTVAYNINGGSGTMEATAFTYDTEGNLRANAFTRPGYAFGGWATSSDGGVVYADGESVNNLTSTAGDTVTLYAVWENERIVTIEGVDVGFKYIPKGSFQRDATGPTLR